MAKQKKSEAKPSKQPEQRRKYRNIHVHTLEQALVLPQRIRDEMGGKPMKRLLLAEALGLSPSSSNFTSLLSSAYKYGFTDGTEKADQISLTTLGAESTQTADQGKRLQALRKASLNG
jgi:hypothetical protein